MTQTTNANSHARWTAEEINYLLDKVGTYNVERIAKNLGRTTNSVNSKISKMGINQMTNQPWITMSAFIAIMHIGYPKFMRWVNKKDFPSYRPSFSKYRRVEIDKFWKWAKTHTELIDWTKFEPLTLGKEPDWVENVRKNTRVRKQKDKWTTHEDYLLERMVKNGATYPELNAALQRSDAAIRRRIYDLYLQEPKRTSPLLYSKEELSYIKKELEKRTPVAMIAKKIGRSERGVMEKIAREGLTSSAKG